MNKLNHRIIKNTAVIEIDNENNLNDVCFLLSNDATRTPVSTRSSPLWPYSIGLYVDPIKRSHSLWADYKYSQLCLINVLGTQKIFYRGCKILRDVES